MSDNTQPQPDLTLVIVGFIWTGGDDFDVTVASNTRIGFTRLHIPEFVERVRKVALQRGMTMGDLCDHFNRELEAKQALEQLTRYHVQWTATDKQTTRDAYLRATTPQVAVNQFEAAGGVLGEGTIMVTEVDAPDKVTTFYARHDGINT